MDTRLYYVKRKDTVDKGRLVEASHPAQALRHVAKEILEVSVPTALEASKLIAEGVNPEDASAKPLPEQPF